MVPWPEPTPKKKEQSVPRPSSVPSPPVLRAPPSSAALPVTGSEPKPSPEPLLAFPPADAEPAAVRSTQSPPLGSLSPVRFPAAPGRSFGALPGPNFREVLPSWEMTTLPENEGADMDGLLHLQV